VGRFLVENGNRICVQPEEGVEEKKLRLFLLGSCLGALLHQRGVVPVHASAIGFGRAAVLLCGRPGAGKSTTAAALIARGHSIVSDDISALSVSPQGVMLAPAYPQLKLSEKSMSYLSLPCSEFTQVSSPKAKYAVRVPSRFQTAPIEVTALIRLSKTPQNQVQWREIVGGASFHTIRNTIYRKKFNYNACNYRFFHQSQALVKHLRVFELMRPDGADSFDAVADLVEGLCQLQKRQLQKRQV
jgi:hypothetical protein